MNQSGGKCNQDVCQLCQQQVKRFLPIIHWNRSDSEDHTTHLKLKIIQILDDKPQVSEYCFHM